MQIQIGLASQGSPPLSPTVTTPWCMRRDCSKVPWPSGSLQFSLIFYALYFAASLLVPIVCAALLGMMLAPLVHGLERLYVPRPIAATLVVIAAVSTLAVAITLLAGPAQSWMERAPEGLRRLEQRLEPLRRSIETISQAREKLQDAAQGSGEKTPQRVMVVRPALLDLMLGTPHVVAPALSVFMLMFLLLVAGDVFLRKLVGIIPTFKEKKRTVEIIRAIEGDISYYLLAFAALNIGMGVAMGIVTALLGIPNPILWAALVAVLNCVPYIGPLVSMGVLALVGYYDIRQPVICARRSRHHAPPLGLLGPGRHAARARARPAAQPRRDLHFRDVVGVAVGHRWRAAGGTAARQLQDRMRAHRAPRAVRGVSHAIRSAERGGIGGHSGWVIPQHL